MTERPERHDGGLIPRPARAPEALRQALAAVTPQRLETMAEHRDRAVAGALAADSLTSLRAWGLTWLRDIEITRRPELAARYRDALHRMHDARSDEATVKAAADDLSKVLDEAMAAVRQ
ncbi:hypothetical protein [Streptomyces apocyni]|uniref:hypothetical protein n=1 Tax=Streptomyces apocyni TaxID=2654677 RepID=UPI001E2CDCEE|nr:hypothetical protein [Streptomyces apocyni]